MNREVFKTDRHVLLFMSKYLDRVILTQIKMNILTNKLMYVFDQYVYRVIQKTESILLKVQNVVLAAINQKYIRRCPSYDLSSAFDTIDRTFMDRTFP